MGFLEAGWSRVTMPFPLPGSDKEAVLELITSRSNRQRQEISQSYKSLYGKVIMVARGQVGWGWGNDLIHLCLPSGSVV